VFYESSVKDV